MTPTAATALDRFPRVAAIIALALGLGACSARPLPCAPPPHTLGWGIGPNRDVDLLFMIDNSSSMAQWQRRLTEALPAFIERLAAPGGLPNLHVAIVSSDMGAGTGTGGCVLNGQAGSFQVAPRAIDDDGALCTTTLQNGAMFVENINGQGNYTAPLADVLSCIAPLGEGGCGFEQPLLSITHALGADNFDAHGRPQPPQENQGFLRDNAYLAIVMLTNEDDCSAPGGAASELFPRAGDGSSLASTLGPPTGYRCNELGHLCGNPPAPPPRVAPGGEATTIALDDCVPAETAGGLISVAAFDAALRALKVDPAQQMLVAAITAVYPDPAADPPPAYGVTWSPAPAGKDELWPRPAPSCAAPSGAGAYAAVRISDWVRRFGPRGLLRSICTDDLRPAMTEIAAAIAGLVEERHCVSELFADRDPATPGLQVDCAVTDYGDDDNGCSVGITVPACAAQGPGAGGHPCWHLDEESACTPPMGAPAGTTTLRLIIERDEWPPVHHRTTIQCATCAPGSADVRCLN